MSSFTYEYTDKQNIYETYEWDNVWIEQANDNKTNRVLYVGDSISCATRTIATAYTNGKILFDGFGTSKGIDNPYFKDSLALFSAQLPKIDSVIFNNGLHGWHLDDEKEYSFHYEEMIKFLLKKYKGVPLFVVLTSFIADEERLKRVKIRNTYAVKFAKKYNLPVIDVYSVTEKNKDLLSSDGVHFTLEGYQVIAKAVVEKIAEILPEYKY
ncbi:MAG: SGNH/GDSL hydrolase family protein [Clostridia bacterium]|nr:SGNH/GDSL hydrolase family protein [Clostridia bacterium]